MKTVSARFGAILAILYLAFPTCLCAQSKSNVVDEVAWVVGDEPILLSDIERQRLYYESMGQVFPGNARCIIPEQMAINKLFLNQAVIDSITPNAQMVNQAVNQWLEQVTNQLGGRDKLEEYLGRNYSQIRDERRKIISEEYTVMQMQQKLVGKVKVSPSEVNRYYEKAIKDSLPFIPMSVEVQIITTMPKIAMSEVDAVKARLIELTNEINSGVRDFETAARLYSQDNETAIRGGEMGFVGRAELEPEFANIAFSLNDPSKVSRVVRTAKGYHIIQLIEKRNDRINVRHIMLRPIVQDEELLSATNRMDSLATAIRKDSISFGDAAKYLSSDVDTRLSNGQMVNTKDHQSALYGTSKFFMQELPQEISSVVAKLNPGQISAPFTMTDKNNNLVVAIVRLKARNEGHRANPIDDYQALKDIVTAKKRGELIEDWIKQKQKQTFVRINPAYRECEFQYPNWVVQD